MRSMNVSTTQNIEIINQFISSAITMGNLGPIFESSISVHRTYNLIADLETRPKKCTFKKIEPDYVSR